MLYNYMNVLDSQDYLCLVIWHMMGSRMIIVQRREEYQFLVQNVVLKQVLEDCQAQC